MAEAEAKPRKPSGYKRTTKPPGSKQGTRYAPPKPIVTFIPTATAREAANRLKSGIVARTRATMAPPPEEPVQLRQRCAGMSSGKRNAAVLRTLAAAGVNIDQLHGLNRGAIHRFAVAHGVDPDDFTLETMPELRCRSYAIPGGKVCTRHGGRAFNVQQEAKRRLEDYALPVVDALASIATQKRQLGPAVMAAKDILDRCGLKEAFKVEIKSDTADITAKNLDLLTEEELKQLISIHRKLKTSPIEVSSDVRNVTPSLVGAAISAGADADADMDDDTEDDEDDA